MAAPDDLAEGDGKCASAGFWRLRISRAGQKLDGR